MPHLLVSYIIAKQHTGENIVRLIETILTCNPTHKTPNEFLIKNKLSSTSNEFTEAISANVLSFRPANSTILLMGNHSNPLCHRPAVEQSLRDHNEPHRRTARAGRMTSLSAPAGRRPPPRDFFPLWTALALPPALGEIRSQMRKTRTVSWINSYVRKPSWALSSKEFLYLECIIEKENIFGG